MKKVTKPSVNYRESDGAKRCGNCAMFSAKTNKCDLVKGLIDPTFVCDRWVKKP